MSKTITIRVSDKNYKQIVTWAKAKKMSVSKFVLERLMEYIFTIHHRKDAYQN